MSLSNVPLMKLPDELLLTIFKGLKINDVLYSLFGLNIRLDRVLRDPCFLNEINFIELNNYTSTQLQTMIDRFCLEILPNIDHLITTLKVPSTLMERVLLSADYSNLSRLDVFIPDTQPVIHIEDESCLIDRLKHRTFVLSVNGEQNGGWQHLRTMRATLLSYLFRIFPLIEHLKFYINSLEDVARVHFAEPPSMFSSTLVELHINPYCFKDLLYLLDGRFDHLRKLVVKLLNIWRTYTISISIDSTPIISLKDFSFFCLSETDAYDEWLVPTFRRMINLERFSLHLLIQCQRRFVDGNTMKEDFLSHMPRLKDFVFDIRSIVPLYEGEIHLQAEEDIQSTLTDLTRHQVITYADSFPNEGNAHCHFHTYPLLSTDYEYVSNTFRGELFANVRYVQLFDERPFEHSFFLRIAQSFPSMKTLRVQNYVGQREKPDLSPNANERLPVITYPSLRRLSVTSAHDDYLEQFLLETKTFVSPDLRVRCKDGQLKRVTNNFTREETKVNYEKVKSFDLSVEID